MYGYSTEPIMATKHPVVSASGIHGHAHVELVVHLVHWNVQVQLSKHPPPPQTHNNTYILTGAASGSVQPMRKDMVAILKLALVGCLLMGPAVWFNTVKDVATGAIHKQAWGQDSDADPFFTDTRSSAGRRLMDAAAAGASHLGGLIGLRWQWVQ